MAAISSLRFRRTTRVRTVVLFLCICGMTVSLQQTSLVPALTDLHHLLNTSRDNVSWVVTATLLTSAVSMPIVSRLADMFGKRKMLIFCLIMVTVGSVIGALGHSLIGVIIGRAVQGLSFAIVPIGISIMRDLLPKHRMGTAIALMSATLGIGGAIGLPAGGYIYAQLGLSAVFIVSAVVGLALLIAVPLIVSESTIRSPGRVDYVGSIVLSGALICLLLPISKGAVWGWSSPLVLGLFGASAVLLAFWLPLQLRLTQPLVDLRTMARRPVLLTNIATLLLGFSMFGQLLGCTQLLTTPVETGAGYGFTPMGAGLFMLPSGAVMVALAPVSAGITNRWGAKVTLVLGGVLVVLGYGVLASIHSLGGLMAGNVLTCAGVAFAYAAMPTIIMRSVPVTETASANGLNALLRSIGTSCSSAVVAMLLTADVVVLDGVSVPTYHAFQMIFVLSAVGALLGTIVATFIPKQSPDLPDEGDPDLADPGAQYDPPEVRAERREIERELAAGETVHQPDPVRSGTAR